MARGLSPDPWRRVVLGKARPTLLTLIGLTVEQHKPVAAHPFDLAADLGYDRTRVHRPAGAGAGSTRQDVELRASGAYGGNQHQAQRACAV